MSLASVENLREYNSFDKLKKKKSEKRIAICFIPNVKTVLFLISHKNIGEHFNIFQSVNAIIPTIPLTDVKSKGTHWLGILLLW